MNIYQKFTSVKSIALLFGLFAGLFSGNLLAAIDISGSTADWQTILKGSNFDSGIDSSLNDDSIEILGNDIQGTLFRIYDDGGTPGTDPADVADDSIAFRIRVSGACCENEDALGGYIWIGMDLDLDGDLDSFLVVNGNAKEISGSGFAGAITLLDAGGAANTSPATANGDNPVELVTLTQNTTEMTFLPVDGTTDSDLSPDGTDDIDGLGKVDRFISFRLSWQTFIDELNQNTRNVNDGAGGDTGPLISTLNITPATPIAFTLSSSNQINTFNNDTAGYDGTGDYSVPYTDHGAFSPPVSGTNVFPVITSNGGGDTATVVVVETETAVTDVNATDGNGDTLTYSKSGTDAGLFTIDSGTGVLTFSALSVIGTYSVTVTVSDGNGGTDSQDLTVDVQADTNPRIATALYLSPNSSPTNADSLTWRVTFSTNMQNVDSSDFSVSGATGTSIGVTEQTATSVYDVTVSGGNLASLDGTVSLGLAGGHNLKNTVGTALINGLPTGTDERDWVLDNTLPLVSIDALSNVTSANEGTYSVSGTCETVEGDVRVTVSSVETQYVSCTADAWSITFDVSSLSDGSAVVIVDANQTDPAGNIGSAAQQTADKDATAPTPPTCTVSPNPAQDSTALTASCTGVETGATVSITNYSCGAESGNAVTCTGTAGTGGGEVSGNATVTITDTVGNSDATATASFTLDNTAPSAPTCTVSPNPANNSTALTATCTGVETDATISIPDYTCGLESGNEITCTATAGTGGGEVGGDATVTITDMAGNSDATATASFTLDNVAPSAANCTVSPNPANNSTALTATCTGVETGGSVSIPNYTCGAESGNEVTCTATAGTGGGEVGGDATATTYDAAANSATSTASFTLDNTAPSAPTCTVSPNPANNSSALTASCTGVETGATVSIPGYTCGAESGNAVTCTATAGTGGGEVSGDATVTITDAAGNSDASATASFTLDNTAPSAPTCTVSPNPANNSTALTASCTGVETGATVSIPGYTCGAESGNAVTCTATAGTGGGEVSGNATITITDTAGNSDTTATASFTLDNVAPSAATCTVSPNLAKAGVALTATCTGVETGGSVSIPNYTCGAESGNEVSCTATSGTGGGEVSGDATATTYDAATNSATSTAAFTLDNVAPAAPTCTVSPNPANDDTSLTASCTGVETGATVVILGYSCGAESGNAVTCSGTAGTGMGKVSGDATITITDGVGNSDTSGTASFTLDNTAPTVTIDSLNTANSGNASTYPVSGSCSTGDGAVSVTVTSVGTQLGVPCIGGLWSTNFDVSGLSDGTNAVTVNASQTDAASNTGNATQQQADKETVVPSPVIASIETSPTNATSIPVTVDFGETVSGFDGSDLQISGAALNGASFSDDGNGQFSFNLDVSVDGTVTVDINASVAVDTAGNNNSAATQFSIVFAKDSDGDGITDADEITIGTNPNDSDSDGDGVTDDLEVGSVASPKDTDGDGVIDANDNDDDNDGIYTFGELGVGGALVDSDGDGLYDFVDADSDNDGILDVTEGFGDTDGDSTPDFRDTDSNNDGVFDIFANGNGNLDINNDGMVDDFTDSDNNLVSDVFDAANPDRIAAVLDSDNDGIPNYREADFDSDNDGFTDFDEVTYGGPNAMFVKDKGLKTGTGVFGSLSYLYIMLLITFVSLKRFNLRTYIRH